MLRSFAKFLLAPALAVAATGAMVVVDVSPAAAASGTVRVKKNDVLRARATPSQSGAVKRFLSNKKRITVTCKVSGQYVRGTVRRSSQWNRTDWGDYIPHAYMAGNPRLPNCPPPPPPAPVVAAPVAVPYGPVAKLTPAAFLSKYGTPAQQSQRDTRVPASVTLAQAILESGWAGSGLSAGHNNFFGMKCFSNNPGSYAYGCVSYPTKECANGVCFDTTATFRVYHSSADSFRDHGMALKNLRHYANAFNYVNDPNRFAAEVHKGGYATDPLYTEKLVNLMVKYNLYQYDLRL